MKKKIYQITSMDLHILKSLPPILVIQADGEVRSAGWTGGELNPYIYVKPPADGYYEFDFVAQPPPEAGADVISTISARFAWPNFPTDLKGIKIYGRTNEQKKALSGVNERKSLGAALERPIGLFYNEGQSQNLTANSILNLKEKPATLSVHGSVITYRDDDKVKLVKANPQGINPKILLLKLEITEGSGPMKGTPKHFWYQENSNAESYGQVTIIHGTGDSFTVDVQKLG